MALSDGDMAHYQRLSNEYVPEVEVIQADLDDCMTTVSDLPSRDHLSVHGSRAVTLPLNTPRPASSMCTKPQYGMLPKGERMPLLTKALPGYRPEIRELSDRQRRWKLRLARYVVMSSLAFGYFEALLHSVDPQAPLAQIARLTSLNNLLDSVGYQRDIYEDFAEETIQLLKHIASTTPNHDDGAALLSSFNDPNVCNGIIMHFRLITSAWMKTRPQNFVPYMVALSIDQYCGTHIEPHAVEIDNIGLHACIEAILQPAGVAVQVLYLDQSEGEHVNDYVWPAEGPNANVVTAYGGVPTVRLLYRPGHYDLLYKAEDLPVPSGTAVTNPQVNFMSDPVLLSNNNVCYTPQHGLDLNHFYLPGFAAAGISPMPFSTNAHSAAPVYTSSGHPTISPTAKAYSVPSYSSPPQDVKTAAPSPMLQGLCSTGGFRPSQYQLQLTDRKSAPVQTEPCQTEAMKQ
ncbi:MAG: hypothetical protein LQ348_000576 [Seirophora lacunosa]|nr:MAG: hypothetical protein LQ348_000576 [Seirophora lacunosa]